MWPKIPEDNSDFDDFWTELIVMTWTLICQILSHTSSSAFLAGFSQWASAQQFYDWRKIERANERLTKNRTSEPTIDEQIGFYVYGARVIFMVQEFFSSDTDAAAGAAAGAATTAAASAAATVATTVKTVVKTKAAAQAAAAAEAAPAPAASVLISF